MNRGDVLQKPNGDVSAAPRRAEPFRLIQALRFFAALAVVGLHTAFYTAERLDPRLGLWLQGANGVRIFFVISGFVMIFASNGLLEAAHGWRAFAVKRVVRIVPMYWAATAFKLVVLLLTPAAVLHASLDWSYVAKSLLFWPAVNVDGEIHPLLGVGWTLIFEMFFYGLFTLALLLRLPPVRTLVPLLVVLALLSHWRTPNWPVELVCWTNPIVLDFAAGMLIAQFVRRGGHIPQHFGWAMLVLGAGYLFSPVLRVDYQTLAGSLVLTVSAAMVVAGTVALEPRLGGRVPRWLMFMGAASYALYLMHPLVSPAVPMVLTRLHLPLPLLSIELGIAAAIVAGVVCHLLIELPATRALTGWIKRTGWLDTGRSRAERTVTAA